MANIPGLPPYLRRFIAEQKYDRYTSQNQAAWRFIMRQNCEFFGRHAVPIYLEGLKKTGISLETIPRISEVDECLARLGWRAVAVEGFLPPSVFLDFQARAILPIACDMRSANHIAYTPAPDIVHEAAGHAPILADEKYSRYLHRYASLAQKAIFSIDDIRLYEAIRYLSDIKENPDATADQIAQAEKQVEAVTQSVRIPSEAAKVARMNWWTVEYGLVGNLKKPKIYGAGLLSSVGESQACLSPQVRKIPLSVGCVDTSYNITEPQPQLFVAEDMDQLVDVLEEFENSLSYKKGGWTSLEEAQRAGAVTTAELDSGLAVSGVLHDFLADPSRTHFIRYSGPVQLSLGGAEIQGHGRERHGSGFSTPLGRWKGAPLKPMYELNKEDLKKLGLEPGKSAVLNFESGFTVAGKLVHAWHEEETLLLLTWKECRITRGNETYFRPEWGEFDMAVGEKILSVSGGPADREKYGEFDVGSASSTPGRTSPFSKKELTLFEAYSEVHRFRTAKQTPDFSRLDALVDKILREHPQEWLLQLELYELSASAPKAHWVKRTQENLQQLAKNEAAPTGDLIRKGMETLSKPKTSRNAS